MEIELHEIQVLSIHDTAHTQDYYCSVDSESLCFYQYVLLLNTNQKQNSICLVQIELCEQQAKYGRR